MKIKKQTGQSLGSGNYSKNLMTTIVVSILTILLAGGLFYTLSQALAKEDYYVLNQDVAAKTQVNESMLTKIETAKGSAPQNAISVNQVRQGTVFTKINLRAGDVLSASNTGLDLDSISGIPDDWSVVSFNISADNAAGGNINKGDYFDVIGVDEEHGAKYVFFNLLALEVNYTQGETKVTSDGKVVPLGEQLQYIVGLPAEQAPILMHTFEKFPTVKLAMSPISLRYKERNVEGLDKVYTSTIESPAYDLYKGTDRTFTPILRAENGLPVTQDNCNAGLISPESLCANLEKLPKNKAEGEVKKVDTKTITPPVVTPTTTEEKKAETTTNETKTEETKTNE